MTSRLATLICLVGLLPLFVTADRASVEDLAQRYSLTTSTTLPFPTATQANADTQNLLVQQWSLGKGRIQDGADRLEFVADPFPRNSVPGSTQNATGPVLQATYPAGSFSHESGGAQFYNLWNNTNGNPFQSMIVSYELAFPQDFDWVKGGKLPGLRGGLNSTGCSGGNEPDGRDCLSARLMWRRNGNGEGEHGQAELKGESYSIAAQPTFIYRNPTASAMSEVSLATMTLVSAFLEVPLY